MTPLLSPVEIDRYHANGFLSIPKLIEEDDLAELRSAYNEVLDGAIVAAGDRMLGGITRQVMAPSEAHPTFDDNAALSMTRSIGKQLIGEETTRVFDMLIYKPPGHPHDTPWHQDMAYAERPVAKPGTAIRLDTLQFWIPMDDVDIQTGCMHFVPGQHRLPLLEHVVVSGDPADPSRLLALPEPERQLDLTQAVAMPLHAGGCTVHSYGTPHYTPPNTTIDRPRRAYIVSVRPKRHGR